MSTQEFHTLQRYAMKMLNDPDDRDELVLLAWQESIRLGSKSSMAAPGQLHEVAGT